MTLEEIIKLLADNTDRGAVIAALQAHAQPVFQEIHDRGFNSATARAKTEKTELENKLAEANTKVGTLENRIADAEAKTPDVAKIRQTYEGEIAELKQRHAAEKKTLNGTLLSERRTRVLSEIKSQMIALGIDSDYADVLIQKDEIKNRLKFADDGSYEIMQAGKDIPISTADGKPLTIFAKELQAQTPAKFLSAPIDRGGGSSGGGGGSGNGGTKSGSGSKNEYDQIREEAKAAQERATPKAEKSAAERLGIVRPA